MPTARGCCKCVDSSVDPCLYYRAFVPHNRSSIEVRTPAALEGGAELFHPALGRPHPRGDRHVAQFPSPRMIFDMAGCGRRQGSAIRSNKRAEERAPLTAVLAGQIINCPGRRKKEKFCSGLTTIRNGAYTKLRTLPQGDAHGASTRVS